MNSFRIARAAIRARPAMMRVAAQRRTYAEAVPDKVRCRDLRLLECKARRNANRIQHYRSS